MQNYVGHVLEFLLAADGQITFRIGCPDAAIPAPGQYLLAHDETNPHAPLAWEVFPAGREAGSFIAATLHPPRWELGAQLQLRGPLGRGFMPPAGTKNLALACLGDTPARLLSLAGRAKNIALFASLDPRALPASIEINPLEDLSEALPWADFLALDVPLEQIPRLAQVLAGQRLPCPAQVLISTPMPCGGLADCGVCAVKTRQGYALACKEGPVFDLELLTGA